jgi:hypothetical protein
MKVISGRLLATILAVAAILCGCRDDCDTTYTYKTYEPVYSTVAEVRNGVDLKEAEEISMPGKIYLFGPYLFINEIGKGIHIIDNTNPSAPVNQAFLAIPGNYDLAVKDHSLYADSYIDLLVFDISNVNEIQLSKRLEGVFQDSYDPWMSVDGSPSIITEWIETETQTVYDECESIWPAFLRTNDVVFMYGATDMAVGNYSNNSVAPGGSNSGIGGSMARFTIVNDVLYTIGSSKLTVFDVYNPPDPLLKSTVEIGWGIETIFPYENNLFIGSQNGMHIYNVSDPELPEYISTFAHVSSCDPVVVNDTVAFVTLRSGNACQGFTNQLDVIDIKNLYSPALIKTYPMLNPHGLGLDGATLFLCEGNYGLKVFDISDILNIDDHLLKFYDEFDAYDVIPYNNILIMIGNDGLYQFDYSDIQNISLMSHIDIIQSL